MSYILFLGLDPFDPELNWIFSPQFFLFFRIGKAAKRKIIDDTSPSFLRQKKRRQEKA